MTTWLDETTVHSLKDGTESARSGAHWILCCRRRATIGGRGSPLVPDPGAGGRRRTVYGANGSDDGCGRHRNLPISPPRNASATVYEAGSGPHPAPHA